LRTSNLAARPGLQRFFASGRGHGYRPFLELAQAPLSTLATAAGPGHRLLMLFDEGAVDGA